MHKSRLGGFIIDSCTNDLLGAARFWSEALGMAIGPPPADEAGKYVRLFDPAGRLDVEVQKVDHPSRVHLDIETDDVEAEVQRLEALGARRIAQIKTWWVMEAPTGHRFCVVRKFSADFDERAHEWG